MKMYEAKFNQLYKGKTYVEIEIIDENPLTTMYCRYNQSRMVCSSIEESSVAKFKDKNGVKKIECDSFNCQYRQKNEQGKMACNRKGWLRFVIPTISRNGVFIMQISSQESINNLYDYFTFQKCQGLSIKGRYILFLKQKEQTNSLGQSFNNFILNIIPKEDFIQNQNPQQTENTSSLSTKNMQNVNKDVVKEQETDNNNKTIISKTEVKEQTENQNVNATIEQQTITKKTRKTKKAKAEEQKEETAKENLQNENNTENTPTANDNTNNVDNSKSTETKEDTLNNYFMLINTFKGMVKDKNGVEKEYLIGNFHDMEDKPYEIVLKPQDAEIQNYGEGTVAKIDVKDVLQRKFAMNVEYINIMPKEKVA